VLKANQLIIQMAKPGLKIVDLPTFGSPTIPHFNPIYDS
jgi:hypothetical protein